MLSVPDWREFPCVAFEDRKDLPDSPGIYIVTSEYEENPLYIGKAEDQSLRKRHCTHDKLDSFIEHNANYIYYCEIDDIDVISGWEKLFIRNEKPILNTINNPAKNSHGDLIKTLKKAGITKDVLFYSVPFDRYYLKKNSNNVETIFAFDLLCLHLEDRIREKLSYYEDFDREKYSKEKIYQSGEAQIKRYFKREPRYDLMLFDNGQVWNTISQSVENRVLDEDKLGYGWPYEIVYCFNFDLSLKLKSENESASEFFFNSLKTSEMASIYTLFRNCHHTDKGRKSILQFFALVKTIISNWKAKNNKTSIQMKKNQSNKGGCDVFDEIFLFSALNQGDVFSLGNFLDWDTCSKPSSSNKEKIAITPPPLNFDYYWDNREIINKDGINAVINAVLPDQNLPKETAFKWLGITE